MNYRLFFVLFLLYFCFSCSEEDLISSPRTVLIYMAADNNLYRNAQSDMEELLNNQGSSDGNLIVYLDGPSWSDNPDPQLFQIKQGKKIPIKQYEQHNSASGSTLRTVINDVITMFPAESYGLVLWSHGTGWLPEGAYENLFKEPDSLRSFGKENKYEISIFELAESLPIKFEYIIFDACLMGGIEVFYQLKNKANVIIASPTEILVNGFPYDIITPFLFTSAPNYTAIAQSYMNYYKNQTGDLQSASIAVINTKQLEPFAKFIKEVIDNKIITIPSNKNNIQKYEARSNTVFYDMQDYLENAITKDEYIDNLKKHLSKTVIYHDFTSCFINKFPIENSCGISIYVSSADKELDNEYKLLDWYIDSKLICY